MFACFFDLLTYFVLSLRINRYRTAVPAGLYNRLTRIVIVWCRVCLIFKIKNVYLLFTMLTSLKNCKLYEDAYDRNPHCFKTSVTRYLIPMSFERDFYEEVIQIYYILMNRNIMWSNWKKNHRGRRSPVVSVLST